MQEKRPTVKQQQATLGIYGTTTAADKAFKIQRVIHCNKQTWRKYGGTER